MLTRKFTGKTLAIMLTAAVSATGLLAPLAQAQYAPQPTYAVPVQAPAVVPLLSASQLDELAAPIALYPDPLIAVMLPAATYPDELAAAASMLRYNAPIAQIEAQPFEPSVKSLAHSPSVLIWMADNPDWTRTLGTAFTYQPQDVMESVQYLRGQALAVGTLVNTPQQVVVVQDRNICIEPAVVDYVYVPVYDWRVCYTRRYEPTFFGLSIGVWFDHDCDWDDRFITIGARWDRGWDHRWDHDHDARRVNVKTDVRVNNTVVNNNTTVNNTTIVNNAAGTTRTVAAVGGTQWKRDTAKPAPKLPVSVKAAEEVPIEKAPVMTKTVTFDRNVQRTPPGRSNTPVNRSDTSRTTDAPRTGDTRGATPRTQTPTVAPQPATPSPRAESPATDNSRGATPPARGRPTQPPARGRADAPPARGREDAPPARGRSADLPPTRVDTPPVETPRATPPVVVPPARGREDTPPARGREDAPPARGREAAPPARGREEAPPARGRASDLPPTVRDEVPRVTPPTEPPARGREAAPPARGREDAPPARGRDESPPARGRDDGPDTQPGNGRGRGRG